MFITFPEDSLFLKMDQRKDRWAVPYHYEALNCRVEHLINKKKKKYIKGKNILDLACHFGTFSYASLYNGASYVHGIDSEKDLINQANELFESHNIDKSLYKFECGDIIEAMENMEENSYDTILCLGVFYYLNDPIRALKLMKKVAKEHIIIDTFSAYYGAVVSKDGAKLAEINDDRIFDLPITFHPLTKSEKKDYTIKDSFKKQKKANALSMMTLPTITTLENYFQLVGLDYKPINWDKYIQNPQLTWKDFIDAGVKYNSHWADIYNTKIRVTYILTHT